MLAKETLGGKSKSTSFFLVNFTLTPFSDSNLLTILETFYYRGWKGRLLAKEIQKQILRVSPGSPDRGVKQGRFYVIKNTRMPAVLVEIGFLTGRLDARRLKKTTHRKRLSYAIAKGILEYLKKTG